MRNEILFCQMSLTKRRAFVDLSACHDDDIDSRTICSLSLQRLILYRSVGRCVVRWSDRSLFGSMRRVNSSLWSVGWSVDRSIGCSLVNQLVIGFVSSFRFIIDFRRR